MNDDVKTSGDEIGLDPATLGVVGDAENIEDANIETLDVGIDDINKEKTQTVGDVPPEGKKPKKTSKVAFVVIILALMAGIGYGVYYYLNLAKKTANYVVTKNIEIALGAELSDDLKDYATFNGINPNNCTLNNKSVDINKEGVYEFSIICSEQRKKVDVKGSVTVTDSSDIEVVTKNVVLVKDSEIKAEDFIESCNKTDCKYEFLNKEEIEELVKEVGGPHEVKIKASFNGKETEVKAVLHVTETELVAYYACSSPTEKLEEDKGNKIITDTLSLGVGNINLNITTRKYEYIYSDEAEYKKIKDENLQVTEFDGIVGVVTFLDSEKTISVLVNLTKEALDLEFGGLFPQEFLKIKEHYTNKEYSCKASAAK